MITLTIPTLRRYDLLRDAVESASQGRVIPTHYHIIDNGGRMPESIQASLLRVAQQTGATIAIDRPGRNLGVAASWNVAFAALPATAPFLIVSNDDVTFYRDTIAHLIAAADAQPEGLFFFPGSGGYKNAWSLFLERRQSWETLGWYDEQISPNYGFFEDNDRSHRLSLIGRPHIPVAHCAYGHVDSATVKTMVGAELDDHWRRFRAAEQRYIEKWGGAPGAERFVLPFDGQRPDYRESIYTLPRSVAPSATTV